MTTKTISNLNETLTEYGFELIGDDISDNPAFTKALKGYAGRGVEAVSVALNALGRSEDAKNLVYKSFEAENTWSSRNNFGNRLNLLVNNGGEDMVPDIIDSGLKRGYIDRASSAALNHGDEIYTEKLAEIRMEEILSGNKSSKVDNSFYFATKLYEKLEKPEKIREVVKWCIANDEYFKAKKAAGGKFKLDNSQSELNQTCAYFAKYDLIRNMVKPFDANGYVDIYYEPEIDENNRIENIGGFRRYWGDGKVEKVEQIDEDSLHGKDKYILLSDGSITKESFDYLEDCGDGINFMPVTKTEVVENVSQEIIDLLSGKEFETNKYIENITGVLDSRIRLPVYSEEESSFKEARKTVKEVLSGLPKEEYEKPVNFELGNGGRMITRIYTGVSDEEGNLIYGYPDVLGTVFDIGVKVPDVEEYRLKIGVFPSTNYSSDVFIGGAKVIRTNDLPYEAKEIGERMSGIKDNIETYFSDKYDEENLDTIKYKREFLIAVRKELGMESPYNDFEDYVNYQIKKVGGTDAFRTDGRIYLNDSLINKFIDCAKPEMSGKL